MAAVLLNPNGERPLPADHVRVAGNVFEYRPDPDANGSVVPTRVVEAALAAMRRFEAQGESVQSDPKLTALGKSAALESAGDAAITAVLNGERELDAMEAGMERVRAEWYAPAKLDPTDAVGANYDDQRTRFILGLSGDRKARFLTELTTDMRPDMVDAILRCPVPLPTEFVEIAKAVIEKRQRRTDPTRAASLDTGYRSLNWGRRQLAILKGVTLSATNADALRLKRIAERLSR